MWALFLLRNNIDKGKLGEAKVYQALATALPAKDYQILNNITLPLEDGGTTQIDHIVVSEFGVFVIETKNLQGWIFGHPNHAQWTQTIHKSRFTFQNPIRQNYKHVQTLARLLNLAKKHFFSVIIFTKQGELKTKMPPFVGHIEAAVTFIQSQQTPVFTPLETSEIASAIQGIKLIDCELTDIRHIEYLQEIHTKKD